MPYLVGQRQLRHFRRHSAVVIDESDDPSVQRSLGRLVHPPNRFRICFVSLANATGCARCGCYPGKTKSTASKISVNNIAVVNLYSEYVEYRMYISKMLFFFRTCRWTRTRGRNPRGCRANANLKSYWRRCSPCRKDLARRTFVGACTPCRRRSAVVKVFSLEARPNFSSYTVIIRKKKKKKRKRQKKLLSSTLWIRSWTKVRNLILKLCNAIILGIKKLNFYFAM